MNLPSNARLFSLLDALAAALDAEAVELLARRAGEDLSGQEALDLRAAIGRALREYVASRQAPEVSTETPAAILGAFEDAGDVLASLEAALDAEEYTLASSHAAELERLAGLIQRGAGELGRHQFRP